MENVALAEDSLPSRLDDVFLSSVRNPSGFHTSVPLYCLSIFPQCTCAASFINFTSPETSVAPRPPFPFICILAPRGCLSVFWSQVANWLPSVLKRIFGNLCTLFCLLHLLAQLFVATKHRDDLQNTEILVP